MQAPGGWQTAVHHLHLRAGWLCVLSCHCWRMWKHKHCGRKLQKKTQIGSCSCARVGRFPFLLLFFLWCVCVCVCVCVCLGGSIFRMVAQHSAFNARDLGLIPGSGRSPGEGNRYPLQYSCLGNPMDRRTLWATVHWIAESDTSERLNTTINCFLLRKILYAA